MKYLTLTTLFILIGGILCGQYFHSNGTKYYFSAPMKKTWYQAQRYCHANSMHLATVHSEEEQQILEDLIYGKFKPSNPSDHFWTSGTDLGQSDQDFYWSESGHSTLYTNWIDGHPKANLKGAILLHSGTGLYKWYDEVFEGKWFFICQDRLFVPDATKRNMYLNLTSFVDG